MKLEKMGEFFDARLEGYDDHQLNCIVSAREFYPFTARQLPNHPNAKILDLGCGTGLELEEYFRIQPTAQVTGIDLAPGMLNTLKQKFPQQHLTLLCGSYFTLPFPAVAFDAAVSVESLHHFTKEEKIPLYQKVRKALQPNGYLLITDYFSLSNTEEEEHRATLERLKAEQGLDPHTFYHYDTPLTVEHEIEALTAAGFSNVQVLGSWGATHTLKAIY